MHRPPPKNPRRRQLLQGALAGAAVGVLPQGAGAQPGRSPQATQATQAAGSVLGAPRYALVIGNDRYRDSPLKNPVNDAKAIAAELQAADFTVSMLLDASFTDMRARVDAFNREIARTKSVGLFYFAGHGIQLSWRNYLLPIDTTIRNTDEVRSGAVDLAEILEGMGKAGNPANIVILDACRNNPFGRDFRIEQRGLSQVDAPVGTLLAYATAPGNVAIDGEGSNGLYTEQLLREIKVPDAKVEDIFKRVRLAVRRQSKGMQIPWESTSLEDDFYFQPPEELRKAAEEERNRRVVVEREAARKEEELRKQVEAERQARLRAEAERQRLLEADLRQKQVAEAELQRRLTEEREAKQRAEMELQKKEEAERRAREQAAAERQRKEEQARLARQQTDAAQRRRLEEAREAKERDEAEMARRFAQEREAWEKIREAREPSVFGEYLYRYPKGSFTEFAQLRLDQLLAQQGEKRIEIVNAPENPFSKGTVRADIGYKVGDSYTYRVTDLYTGSEIRVSKQVVTSVTETEVRFNDGRLILDPLGNLVKAPDGRRFSGWQVQPLEFAVGRKWTSQYEVLLPSGEISRNEEALRITARESLTVPAGTFDCFKIEGAGSGFATDGGQVQTSAVFWSAPGRVRRVIASERRRIGYRRGGPGRVLNAERNELIAFSQA